MIEVDGLGKLYGDFPAIWDISFRVDKGEIVGFLGPNGAGKTTLMRILAGYSPATFGTAIINGFDVFSDSLNARASLGYLPETNPLYPELKIDEYLSYRAKLKGVPRSKRKSAIDRTLASTYLTPRRKQLISTLSKGLRQRVGLADALINDPPILILDEPTSGLDPIQQQEVRDLMLALGEEKTVLLSTHILPEVERLCGRVLIINAGQLVPAELVEHIRKRETLNVVLETDDAPKIQSLFSEKLPAGTSVSVQRDGATVKLTLHPADGADIRRNIYDICRTADVVLLELSPVAKSLDQVFTELILGPSGAAFQAPQRNEVNE